MIVTDFLGYRGRLGNALYQVASTIGIGERLGEPVRFNADWIHRPYFSVPDAYFDSYYEDEATPIANVLAKELAPGPTSTWLQQFLQNYEWFEAVLPKIRRYFAPSDMAVRIMEATTTEWTREFDQLERPILSVHVRRGDNVIDPGVPHKHLYWPVPPLRYYERAIAELRDEAASVVVFSDDIPWCEEHIDADYYHVGVSRPKEHEADYLTAPVLDWIDLQLMARCEAGHVLSNSTFGWWGAMLAGDERAIYPWPIVGPKLPEVKMEMALPPSWRRLAYG